LCYASLSEIAQVLRKFANLTDVHFTYDVDPHPFTNVGIEYKIDQGLALLGKSSLELPISLCRLDICGSKYIEP